MIRFVRKFTPIVILALLCSALVPAHAAAIGGDGSSLLEDDIPGNTADGDGDSTNEEEPGPGGRMPEELAPEGPVGPVGSTGVPTYEALWVPGGIVPFDLNIAHDHDDVDLLAIAPDNGSWLMALLIIRDENAPTEYRFENAVPSGHTAELQPDGSVSFYDNDGEKAGGIGAPWAVDAMDQPVAKSYQLEGSTLVQTVDHEGAAYPVVADPIWAAVVGAVYMCGFYPQCVNAVTTAARFSPAVVVPAVSHAWNARTWLVTGSDGSTNRPTNSCNMRNRQEC